MGVGPRSKSTSLTRNLRAITPPIFWSGIRQWRKSQQPSPPGLFGGEDALFKSAIANARVYGEYGCGASTTWVLSHTPVEVLAVESTRYWAEKVEQSVDTDDLQRARIHYVDLGEVKHFGRPISYEKRTDFSIYTDWIWEQSLKPDVVLIDGRFRVCCFLTTLKSANPGTKVLFDDYVNRPHYHIVEKYLERSQSCGRQCLFIVPDPDLIDYDGLEAEIRNFRHVMD